MEILKWIVFVINFFVLLYVLWGVVPNYLARTLNFKEGKFYTSSDKGRALVGAVLGFLAAVFYFFDGDYSNPFHPQNIFTASITWMF